MLGYDTFSILHFDIIGLIYIIKCAAVRGNWVQKKFLKKNSFILILFFIFLTYYFCQLFNPHATYFQVIGTSKIYLYPFIFFFNLLHLELGQDKDFIEKLSHIVILLIIFETILCFHQHNQGEEFLIQISNHYKGRFKNDVFTGENFRAFGTSFSPGSIATNISLSVGIILMSTKKRAKPRMLKILSVLSAFSSLFVLQVRASMLKFILICTLVMAQKLPSSIKSAFSEKASVFAKYLPITLALLGLLIFGASYLDFDSRFKMPLERTISLLDQETYESTRLPFFNAIKITKNVLLKYPMGMGPGSTGAATSLTEGKGKMENFAFNRKIGNLSLDNFLVSLAYDFGLGMIFYLSIITYVMAKCLSKLVSSSQSYNSILSSGLATMITILIGNWGAAGLTYNPESFLFWLVSAITMSTGEKA